MRKFILLLWLLPFMMVCSDLEAQTVTVPAVQAASGSGAVTNTAKTNASAGGTINLTLANRAWFVFDLTSIPFGAAISSVSLTVTTASSLSLPSKTVYGVGGDQSGIPASTLYGYGTGTALSGTFDYASTKDQPVTVSLNASGISLLQNNLSGSITLVIGGPTSGLSAGSPSLYGGTHANRPYLTVSYTGGSLPVPTITANNSPVCTGGSITLTASSIVTSPVFNWTGPGYSGTGATISIPNATSANAGVYSVTITAGGNTSSPATATVVVNPAVTPSVTVAAQPSGTICAGTPVTFTATPANGGTTPVYQWRKNGAPAGTNSATHTDNGLNNNDVITCELTSNAGCASPATVTSNTVTAAVNSGPQQPVITVNGDTLISSATTGNQWFRNNIAISGATAPVFVTKTPGWYQVQVTGGGCSRRSDSVQYNAGSTGVNEQTLRESVSVYPSPFTRNITVDIQGDVAGQPDVYIISELGQTVYRGVLRTGKNELALPSLTRGIYSLFIQDSKGNRAIMRLVRI